MNKIKFAFNLLLPIILGSIVGFIIKDSIDYEYLVQPPLSPSGIVFPIVWSILYLCMGLGYALYKKEEKDVKKINITYYTQLIFNLLWPILFFVFAARFISIIWIIILDVLVIVLFYMYYKNNNKISAYLLIPYIMWNLFATYLNIGVYILN